MERNHGTIVLKEPAQSIREAKRRRAAHPKDTPITEISAPC